MASIAASESDPRVRHEDPFARQLLRWGDGDVAAARLTPLHPLLRAAIERISPGIYGYALARLHHMDQVLREELAAGIDSLVILGAGYDTRPYRMRNDLATVRVFEVDHAATSRDKRERVARAMETVPANIGYIEADLARDDLLERLARHGHDHSTRTLFLLSGVSMYLAADAMVALLDLVASHTSERTSLLFDYIDAEVLVAPDRFFGKEWMARAAKAGEPPQWGIPAGEADALLRQRNLELVASLGAAELTARYLTAADGSIVARPFEFGAVAHARVAS